MNHHPLIPTHWLHLRDGFFSPSAFHFTLHFPKLRGTEKPNLWVWLPLRFTLHFTLYLWVSNAAQTQGKIPLHFACVCKGKPKKWPLGSLGWVFGRADCYCYQQSIFFFFSPSPLSLLSRWSIQKVFCAPLWGHRLTLVFVHLKP